MSEPINKDEERWLDALAGKPELDAGDPAVFEALAMRTALQERAQRLDAVVPPADDALLEQLRFRLRREHLAGKRTVFRGPAAWALAASVVLGVGLAVRIGLMDGQPGPTMFERYATRSTLTEPAPMAPQPLAFATLVSTANPEAKAEDLVRGMPVDLVGREQEIVLWGSSAVAERWSGLIGRESKRSIQDFSDLFREQVRAGVPVVLELGQDQIMLVVQATDTMLEYLRSQDIEPTVTDGEIVILILTGEAITSPSIRP